MSLFDKKKKVERTRVTKERLQEIYRQADQGIMQKRIAENVGVSGATVSYWLGKRLEKEGSTVDEKDKRIAELEAKLAELQHTTKEDWWSHDGALIKEPPEGTEYWTLSNDGGTISLFWTGDADDLLMLSEGEVLKTEKRAELELKKRQYFQEMRIAATKNGHHGMWMCWHEVYYIYISASGLGFDDTEFVAHIGSSFMLEEEAREFVTFAKEKYTEEELASFYNVYKGEK